MTVTAKAPDFTTNTRGVGYPSGGAKIGPAWQAAWDRMRQASAEDYLDGPAMAEAIGKDLGISPNTVLSLLFQAADRGYLERTHVPVAGNRGVRNRTHYRINRGPDRPDAE